MLPGSEEEVSVCGLGLGKYFMLKTLMLQYIPSLCLLPVQLQWNLKICRTDTRGHPSVSVSAPRLLHLQAKGPNYPERSAMRSKGQRHCTASLVAKGYPGFASTNISTCAWRAPTSNY